ncbi:hypothetical protein ATANTOWER_014829 [Ataeniobius toweri]|uniref:Uncharacterized protein n=1 Tax=Ataeniobius toweri TaxID=208326 RepID=A0ABU7C2X5_9TELE|nr:hypothetical protein [Ataeniobius toweri]
MGGAAASLGDSAVVDEDAGLLAATLPSAGRETTAPDVGDTSSPAETQEGAPRRRRARASLPDQSVQPREQAENGAEPPHAPSAPAAVERAEPPGRSADSSSPPPSDAEPSDPRHLPSTRPRGPYLAETFC